MEATKRSNTEKTEKTMRDLGTAVSEGEELLESAMDESSETHRQLRAKLQAAVDKGKELYAELEEKTVAAAKATDRAVREHPYEAMGVAFGVGLLIGVLAMRSRRD